ncbi:MAG: hypothetical protein ABSA79_12145 [Candidatus Bathyarchaeia archaeon]|jgi:hypothetical protein
MTCKFARKCQLYSTCCLACTLDGGDYCGAYKNLKYGRIRAIVEREQGIIINKSSPTIGMQSVNTFFFNNPQKDKHATPV